MLKVTMQLISEAQRHNAVFQLTTCSNVSVQFEGRNNLASAIEQLATKANVSEFDLVANFTNLAPFKGCSLYNCLDECFNTCYNELTVITWETHSIYFK